MRSPRDQLFGHISGFLKPFGVASLLALLMAGLPHGAAAGSSLPGIKGADDRHRVDAAAYPWSAIGRLKTGTDTRCTAVLIGPSLAVTAAHCLWDGVRGQWTPAVNVTFSAGYQAGRRIGSSGVTRYDVASGYLGASDLSLSNSANDWAFLHLTEPLGHEAGSIGLFDLTAEAYAGLSGNRLVVMQAGYSLDQSYVLTAHIGCHLHGWAMPGLLRHDCDATTGDSGSPIFAWIDGSFRLLGLHVSTFGRRDSSGDVVWGGAVTSADIRGPAIVAGASTLGTQGRAAQPSREVWALLEALGYDPAARGLNGAVTAFQADRNMTITGAPSPEVLGAAVQSLR